MKVILLTSKHKSILRSSLSNQFIFRLLILCCISLSAKISYAQYDYDEGNKVSAISPLMTAVNSEDIEGVKFFSKAGRSILNKKNIGGATALHIAARNNNLEIVKILISNGADVNISDNDGWTPLMRSASVGNPEIVSELLKSGADVLQKNSANETAIIYSANSSCAACMEDILNHIDDNKTDANLLNNQIEEAFLIANKKIDSPTKEILTKFRENIGHQKKSYKLDDENLPDITNKNFNRKNNSKIYILKKKPTTALENKKSSILEEELGDVKIKNYSFKQGAKWSPAKTEEKIIKENNITESLQDEKNKKYSFVKTEEKTFSQTITHVKSPDTDEIFNDTKNSAKIVNDVDKKEIEQGVDTIKTNVETKEVTKKKIFNFFKSKDETNKKPEKEITSSTSVQTKSSFRLLKPDDELNSKDKSTVNSIEPTSNDTVESNSSSDSSKTAFRLLKPDDEMKFENRSKQSK